MAMQILTFFEIFCFNFIRGVGSNINLIQYLIHNDVEKSGPQSHAEQKSPERMTELARRRAQKQKTKGETHESPRQKKTVRAMLFWMIKTNCIFCVVLLIGMTHVVFPLFTYMLGDLWKRNYALESAVTALLVAMWMTPLWLITKIANVFWMNELSDLAYKETSGKPVQSETSYFISDMVYSLVLQFLFIIQILLVSMVPFTVCGFNVFELVLTALSYSMFAFEYKWMNMAYDVRKRLDLIDKNFGYHLGFGFPLSFLVLCFESFWMRFILYSILFPALILCATYASEPKEVRGKGTYIFYPSEKVTDYFFQIVQTLGLRSTLYCLLFCVFGYFLFWLGLLSFVYSGILAFCNLLPVNTMLEQWQYFQNSVLDLIAFWR